MDDQLDSMHKVELALLRVEYQNRHGASIEYVKELVGEGLTYENAVASIVVSETGAYYELKDLPEEFFGATGEGVERIYLSNDELTRVLNKVADRASKLPLEPHTFLLVYSPTGIIDRRNCYLSHFQEGAIASGGGRTEIGAYRLEALPLFYKARIDGEWAGEPFAVGPMMIFGLTRSGDSNLVVIARFDQPAADLGIEPRSSNPN